MSRARELLAGATARLAAAGVPSPRVDAEILLAALLDTSRTSLVTRDTVPASVAATFDEHVTRRAAREPLQHITGVAPFRHIQVAVGPGVFVPRPETELLVDAVLPHLREVGAPTVVDLCAGSGALALAVADEVPDARVVAVEVSDAALSWLTRNAADTPVRVVAGDVRDPELLRLLYGVVDAVVANPPYVPRPADVAPEVRADPGEAVFAGTDGLELMSALIARAAQLLKPGGMLAVEHDDTHGAAVPALLESDGHWTSISGRRDLAGRPRYAVAIRR